MDAALPRSNVKLSSINSEAERKKIQRRISCFEEKYPKKYSEKFAYNRTQ
ncbi:MAG: hypothetical protein ACOC4M_10910 [Promethearchaeia archaeon]